jgi:predicted nucleic acid-binding protein
MAISNLTAAATIDGTVSADPDDDHVIACALSAQADIVVQGTRISSISKAISASASSRQLRC